MTTAHDPFGHAGQAQGYAQFRPRYNADIIKRCLTHNPSLDRKMALDVCTGTGQVATLLAPHFQQVIGLDRSAEQLKNADTSHSNVQYRQVQSVEQLPYPNETFSLITVAQALHWLDQDAFINEASRVLCPGGVLAVLGYGICSIQSNDAAQKLFQEYYFQVLGSHLDPSDPNCLWEIDRRLVDSAFQGLAWPLSGGVVHREWVYEERDMPLSSFVGYLRTFSAYHALRRTLRPEDPDPLETLVGALVQTVGDAPVRVRFPYFVLLGQKRD